MHQHKAEDQLPEARRKEIFQALVDAQDKGMSVAQSVKFIAQHYGVSEGQVKEIEREGIDSQWPPL